MAQITRMICYRLNGGEFFNDSGLYLIYFTIVTINKG